MVDRGLVSASSRASPLFGLGIGIVAQVWIDFFEGDGISCPVAVSLSVVYMNNNGCKIRSGKKLIQRELQRI